MSDRTVKGVLAGGLLLHAGAVAAGLAGLGRRRPLIAATASACPALTFRLNRLW